MELHGHRRQRRRAVRGDESTRAAHRQERQRDATVRAGATTPRRDGAQPLPQRRRLRRDGRWRSPPQSHGRRARHPRRCLRRHPASSRCHLPPADRRTRRLRRDVRWRAARDRSAAAFQRPDSSGRDGLRTGRRPLDQQQRRRPLAPSPPRTSSDRPFGAGLFSCRQASTGLRIGRSSPHSTLGGSKTGKTPPFPSTAQIPIIIGVCPERGG